MTFRTAIIGFLVFCLLAYGLFFQIRQNGAIMTKLELAQQARAEETERDEKLLGLLKSNRASLRQEAIRLERAIGSLASLPDDGCLSRVAADAASGVQDGGGSNGSTEPGGSGKTGTARGAP